MIKINNTSGYWWLDPLASGHQVPHRMTVKQCFIISFFFSRTQYGMELYRLYMSQLHPSKYPCYSFHLKNDLCSEVYIDEFTCLLYCVRNIITVVSASCRRHHHASYSTNGHVVGSKFKNTSINDLQLQLCIWNVACILPGKLVQNSHAHDSHRT